MTFSTRELIVREADQIFYEKGFEAASFSDIAAAVGISRGNFYYHFKTKDDILDAVITHRLATTRAMLDDWARQSPSAVDRIMSFIQMLISNQTTIMAFGCPVGTLCSELAKLDHAARTRAAAIFGLFREWLEEQFRELGQTGNASELALHLLARSQGIATLANAFRDEDFVCTEVAALKAWLQSIIDDSSDKNRKERKNECT